MRIGRGGGAKCDQESSLVPKKIQENKWIVCGVIKKREKMEKKYFFFSVKPLKKQLGRGAR